MGSSVMRRRKVQILQIADGLADASAEQGEESAADDNSSRDWRAVASAIVRAEGRSNAKPDRCPDENVSGVSVIPPRRLVSSSRIWTLGWKWMSGSTAAKLRQRCVACVERDVRGLCVFTSRRGHCVDAASIFSSFSFSFSSLIFYRLRHRARGKRESSQQEREEQNAFCIFHRRILETMRR
jgi:hypothetical protein